MGTIPSDIQSSLTQIAERLWTGHASIMVGAGFSKNAINTVNPSKLPPDWAQLGDLLYEKLYSKKPNSGVKYLSVLKLAEEFEAVFGRSTLEHFVRENIADNMYEPSEVHKMLMELPWSDVFTTNYDTLLERSCKEVLSRKYDVVVNQNDLVYSNKPRVIKLHGSLPSERPFIITEEDYRVYPKKYAPFVNTVQQSLLENTLCLIGFSGEDPNFLNWIGWINDNLGYSNAPKIYLVGALNLSESQKRLLSNKNIRTIDLSNCHEVNSNHKKSIEFFINFLENQRHKRENLEWPLISNLKPIRPSDNKKTSSLLEKWIACRNKYPNWIILPKLQRDILWIYTESESHNKDIFKDLKLFIELDYIYELNWRLEKCLIPIWNNIAPHFQNILNRYNFFPNEILEEREINSSTYKTQKIDWNKYRKQWIELSLSMLRHYREESLEEEWTKNHDVITLVKKNLSHDQLANLYYEQILNAIFKMKHEDAKHLLNEWPKNSNSLFWEAKRAMLMTEFGQLSESENLLESVLIEIRKRLNLSPVSDDYLWVSQEAYVMFLLRMVQQNIRWKNIRSNDKTNENREDFNERWNDLLQFKCDPWGEIRYFDIVLNRPFVPNDDVTTKYDFQIGNMTRTFKMGASSEEYFIAYTFLRYLDELSIPLSLSASNISKKTINGALERIILSSPSWGIAILNRYRDSSVVEVVFDRQQLIHLSAATINTYIRKYLEHFDEIITKRLTDPIAKAFTDKVSNILAKLCTKCSEELRVEILKLYEKLIKNEIPLPGLDQLFKNLIDSSNRETIKLAVELLIDSPILDSNCSQANTTFPEPFSYLSGDKIDGKLKITQTSLNYIFEKASETTSARKNALRRLIILYRIGHLNKKQIKRLFDIIWKQRDKNNFPNNTYLHYYEHRDLPKPTGIDAEKIFKQYITYNNFNIEGLKEDKNGIGISRGKDKYVSELLNGSETIGNSDGVKWNQHELDDILTKCEEWWNLDRHYLTTEKNKEILPFGSVYEEFFVRFENLVKVISYVFGIRLTDLSTVLKKRIEALINDMDNYNIPVLKAKVVFGHYPNFTNYLRDVQNNLTSKNKGERVLDALDSIILSVHMSPYKEQSIFISELLNTLSIPLKWHITSFLGDIFDVLKDFTLNTKIDLSSINEDIHSALNYTFNMTREEIPLGEYLVLRRKSISLAGKIHTKLIHDNSPIPDAILKWKAVSESNEEFGDIKNRWAS